MKRSETMKVFQIMTRRVFTCRPDDNLATAAGVLWDNDVGCAPVVERDGRVVGMITDRDICMAAYTRGRRLEEIDVGGVISRQLHVCAPDQSLAEAEEIMRLQRIRRTPVVDGEGHLLGILSLNDLAREAVQQKRRRDGETLHEEVTATLAAVSQPRPGKAPSATA
jgi:CBS domain-containing protein